MTNDEIIKNIANNLRKLRTDKGLTQAQLVKEIGEEQISLRSYKTYENENSGRVPLLEKIAIIADYYKCSLDFIIYGKDSIYSDSFTLKDNLKRLAGLIYSFVLIPQREEDKNSPHYGKYFFMANDKEVTYYMDKINLISKQKNDEYEYYGVNDFRLLENYYEAIKELDKLDINLAPNLNRLKTIMLESGTNFEEYYESNKKKILKKRKIASYEK